MLIALSIDAPARSDDRALLELLARAETLTADGELESALDAWTTFADAVDTTLGAGEDVGLPILIEHFDAGFHISRMYERSQRQFEEGLPAGSGIGSQSTSMTLGFLQARETWLMNYLAQFDPGGAGADGSWDAASLPPNMLEREIAARYDLGTIGWDRGRILTELLDPGAARIAWIDAREMLAGAIELALGHPIDGTGSASGDGGALYDGYDLGMLAELYLRQVALLDGPDAYTEAAEQAYEWMTEWTREDHQVLIQMRLQAQEWSRQGRHEELTARLAAVVRRAHRELFENRYANLTDNVSAFLVGIKAAVELGRFDEAERLMNELNMIDDLSPHHREQIDRLTDLLGSEETMRDLLNDFLMMVERLTAERGAVGASSTGGATGDAAGGSAGGRVTTGTVPRAQHVRSKSATGRRPGVGATHVGGGGRPVPRGPGPPGIVAAALAGVGVGMGAGLGLLGIMARRKHRAP